MFIPITSFPESLSEIWSPSGHHAGRGSRLLSTARPTSAACGCLGSSAKMSISHKSSANKHYAISLYLPCCCSQSCSNVQSLKNGCWGLLRLLLLRRCKFGGVVFLDTSSQGSLDVKLKIEELATGSLSQGVFSRLECPWFASNARWARMPLLAVPACTSLTGGISAGSLGIS